MSPPRVTLRSDAPPTSWRYRAPPGADPQAPLAGDFSCFLDGESAEARNHDRNDRVQAEDRHRVPGWVPPPAGTWLCAAPQPALALGTPGPAGSEQERRARGRTGVNFFGAFLEWRNGAVCALPRMA